MVTGTHAITVGLLACLRPSDELLCVTGDPYDTLEEVLGVRGEPGIGNLADLSVTSRCHYGLFTAEGGVDVSTIADSINVGMTLLGAQFLADLHVFRIHVCPAGHLYAQEHTGMPMCTRLRSTGERVAWYPKL